MILPCDDFEPEFSFELAQYVLLFLWEEEEVQEEGVVFRF
jgi:hypothetical protein